MSHVIAVRERDRTLRFSFGDMLRYHGGGSPGGVAHAFKVLERSLPLLDPEAPAERREITIRTAFAGPGARDAFELATRAVSDERYVVDTSLARPERGRAAERFVFELGYRSRIVTLVVRDGFVSEEFIDLARKAGRTEQEEAHLDRLKAAMADRVMERPAAEVYDVVADG